jgi:hypothetical protein
MLLLVKDRTRVRERNLKETVFIYGFLNFLQPVCGNLVLLSLFSAAVREADDEIYRKPPSVSDGK